MKVSELTVGTVIDYPDKRGYRVMSIGQENELGYQRLIVVRDGRPLVLYLRHDVEVAIHEETP